MTFQKVLTGLWVLAWPLLFVAHHEKARLPPARTLKAELRQAPLQKPTEEKPFSFAYRGRPYDVKPLAAYELWGVVVSHNNIGSIADIYHTGDAVDTKDVCVAWGENATTDDLSKVKFWNGPFTCYFLYPEGAEQFKPGQISNNHLLTKDPSVREKVNGLQVGDQVRFKGLLVSYRPADEPENWRASSQSRDDTGPGACEVVYVRELDVLERNSTGWRSTWKGAVWTLLGIPFLKLVLMLAA